MKITNYQNLEKFKNPHGIESYKLYDADPAVIMHLHIKPGESLKPHITPVDAVFYVLEGNPMILVGEEKVQVNQDDIIESPKNIIHCISNDTKKIVRVLVMKLPKPTSKTIIV